MHLPAPLLERHAVLLLLAGTSLPRRRALPGTPTAALANAYNRLLKRVFDIDLQHCPNCGAGELKIIAAILERPAIEKILTHLGIDPQPPPRGRAREAGQDFPA